MRALSIRQPFAELILRGIKTIEYRTIATTIIGERFFIYAPLKHVRADLKIWSRDLGMPDANLPDWMIELAEQVKMIEPGALLPTGVIVGSAVIEKVSEVDSMYQWHLADVQRAKRHRKPARQPQPVWFRPF
jgi:predicted transcriptional regulator